MHNLFYYLASILAVIFVFVPHEFAHAFVAYKNGDGTAKFQGRMTLNPIKHIDPVGFVLCIFTGFGWAKPVPIYPANFRNYRKGLFTTAIAGVVTNYIIAFLAYPLCLVLLNFVYYDNYAFLADNIALLYLVEFGYQFFGLVYLYSLSVFVFNLIPFYPLDGFRIVESFTREINPVRRFLKNYGQYILIILVVESFLCDILISYTNLPYVKYFDVLGYVQIFARYYIGYPINAFWNWIINPVFIF